MYKMSEVVYKLSNGRLVNTLKEAKDSGLQFEKLYLTIEEDFPIGEIRAKNKWTPKG